MNLASAGVKTVQDFLRMCIVDPGRLRSVGNSPLRTMRSKHQKESIVSRVRIAQSADNSHLLISYVCVDSRFREELDGECEARDDMRHGEQAVRLP